MTKTALALVLMFGPLLSVGQQLPEGTVDGAQHPELIPDTVAFRLFFAAIADKSAASPLMPTAKQERCLRPVNLGAEDRAAVLSVVSDFAQSANNAMLLDIVAVTTVNALRSRMSPVGFQRILAHVRSEKRFMKRMLFPNVPNTGQ